VGAVDAVADQPRHLHPGEPYPLQTVIYDDSGIYDTVDVRFNSRPTQIYELTLTIHDAPGVLEPGDNSFIDYKVNTVECVPPNVLDKKSEGTLLTYEPYIPFELNWLNKKIGTVYKTYIAKDLMVDEDYYNKGVCHWSVNHLDLFIYRLINKDSSVDFRSVIRSHEIEVGKPIKTYFLKSDYTDPKPPNDGLAGFVGRPLTEKEYLNTPEAERDKFFYTIISIKKVKPRPALQRWIWLKYTPDAPQ
jgi:hypothetical protein